MTTLKINSNSEIRLSTTSCEKLEFIISNVEAIDFSDANFEYSAYREILKMRFVLYPGLPNSLILAVQKVELDFDIIQASELGNNLIQLFKILEEKGLAKKIVIDRDLNDNPIYGWKSIKKNWIGK